ncbi:MAG: diacylglycerol kinase family lipid kinase [Bacteroidales bacterium]|nr:diacylglycerol kinase family lipid kinase [Bacteroidales bacterium]
MNKIKAIFIVNPFSGLGRQKGIEKYLGKALDHKKFDYSIAYTEEPNHATKLCEEAIEKNIGLVVAVGGDGTVNEVARPLVGKNIPFGIIPSGSGNGLARHLKIPLETRKAIALLNGFKTQKIDTVEVNDRFFVSIAGVGFDAFVAKKFAGQKRRGFFKYAQIALGEYFAYKPKKFTLNVDGKTLKKRALFISIANSDQFGYNTSIAPQAKIDDGMVDICIMKKVPLWKTIFLAPLLFSRNIDRSSYVEIIRAREVDIKQTKKRINLDGESIKMGKSLHFKVLPKSLIVVVP